MISFIDKKEIFIGIINQKEESYADSFNADIELIAENYDYSFLNTLHTREDIDQWIMKLKSRILMKEDDAPLEDIIYDYIEYG